MSRGGPSWEWDARRGQYYFHNFLKEQPDLNLYNEEVQAALIAAGAIDGLSIGYRTVKAKKNDKGQRLLQELELWEVSLVTFPMLPSARVSAKGEDPNADMLRELAAAVEDARQELRRP